MSPRLVDERLRETLRSYDAHPDFYADRYRAVDLGRYRSSFLSALPDRVGWVLDGGPGRDSAEFHKAGVSVVGLDLSMGFLALARAYAPVPFVNADLRALPFRAGSFDGVWLCSSLVHLPAKYVAVTLREVGTILRPGGVLFASVIHGTDSGWRRDQFTGRRWFKAFAEHEFTGLIEDAGLSLIRSDTVPGVAMGSWVNVFARREK
jgi:SAM-dependent methyltransferase